MNLRSNTINCGETYYNHEVCCGLRKRYCEITKKWICQKGCDEKKMFKKSNPIHMHGKTLK